jgi:putative peptidoglycan lipid II flippase
VGDHKLNSKAALMVSAAVMCSRVLGLAREMLFAWLFGAGRLMDAFLMAFRVPNLLRDLFAEGALSTAFITVFSRKIEQEGEASAWRLASKIATLTTVFMSLVTILGIVFADVLVAFLAPGWDAEKVALTVTLTRIMYPFILLVSLAALVMGMLNSKNVFGVPAMASSFFNIGSILGGIGFGYLLDPTFGEKSLAGLAIGTLVGGALQLGVQLPSLWKVGFRFHPDFQWRDAGVRLVLGIMAPSVIAASAVQINVMVNAIFASYLQDGAVSWLQFAFRLMQLPLGVFGVAVATITLPVISRIAAGADRAGFGPTLGKALRLALFLTLPSAVGLFMLAHPIISVIYERGSFTGADSLQTALVLQFYAMGLLAYSCIKVLSPAFYAIDRRWTPMTVSFISIAVNAALNWFFVFHTALGPRGLALSTGISATLNFLLLYLLMHRAAGRLESSRLLASLSRCVLASAALGAVCWAGTTWLHHWMFDATFVFRLASLLGVVSVAGAVYFAACFMLRVEAMQDAMAAVRRKLRR